MGGGAARKPFTAVGPEGSISVTRDGCSFAHKPPRAGHAPVCGTAITSVLDVQAYRDRVDERASARSAARAACASTGAAEATRAARARATEGETAPAGKAAPRRSGGVPSG